MRLLTVSSLYPNAVQPTHGIFVENRLRRIVTRLPADGGAQVIAPVPWFPFRHPAFGTYARFAAIPRQEARHGMEVRHPRFLVLPRRMTWQPYAYLRTIRREIRDLRAQNGDFDLIDAHYLYPDGIAAARLGSELGKPVVVTIRGSDVHQIAELPGPRRQILAALPLIDRIVAVSSALGAAVAALGYPKERIVVLRNGVDTDQFRPLNPAFWRKRAGNPPHLIASVGLLISRKGHDLAIRALADTPGAHLLLVGEGPEERRLRALAASLGLEGRVTFAGAVPHDELAAVYSAADALVLASAREGWPNVLLEAMACGTPVVATNVGGIPEIVARPEAGIVVPERTPAALAKGLRRLLDRPPDRQAVRHHAKAHGWDEVIARQIELYEGLLGQYFETKIG